MFLSVILPGAIANGPFSQASAFACDRLALTAQDPRGRAPGNSSRRT
jgi:hypothetical protein